MKINKNVHRDVSNCAAEKEDSAGVTKQRATYFPRQAKQNDGTSKGLVLVTRK
jgi:hypothetical protein